MARESYYNLEHQQKYREKTKSVTVSFNLEDATDLMIFKHLDTVGKKSTYIKELIMEDIKNK